METGIKYREHIWVSPDGEEKFTSQWVEKLNLTCKAPRVWLSRHGYIKKD
jgi:hypothetical protein